MKPTEASMDEICRRGGEFQLQKHQRFLQEWTTENEWRTLLLYHEIGSGKTCTSITIAEAFLRAGGGRVKVILPAELLTNFQTELRGACADHANEARYELTSIQKFRMQAERRYADLRAFMEAYTDNSLIIIDEVQNVISTAVDDKRLDELFQSGSLDKVPSKAIHAFLIRALTYFARPTAKFLFLTATPLFDSIKEVHQLALIMNDHINERVPAKFLASGPHAPRFSISDFVDLFRNKVSYFPRLSPNAYPRVIREHVPVPITKTIDDRLSAIEDEEGFHGPINEDVSEAFLAKQRQAALFYKEGVTETDKAYLDDTSDAFLREHGPKIFACMQSILNPALIGKHCVYCSFNIHGLHILQAALNARGWSDADAGTNYHRYVVWKGGLTDRDKHRLMSRLNSPDNMDGKDIRLVLGSPAIKAGISFYHMQYMHILDSTWNMSSIRQIEGRVNRYCSHVAITPEVTAATGLKRQVTIRTYFLTRPHRPSLDDKILGIVSKKLDRTSKGETMLQNVALDHWLFQELRGPTHAHDRPASPRTVKSPVYHEDESLRGRKQAAVCGPDGYTVTDGEACEDGYHEFKTWSGNRTVKCCSPNETFATVAQRKFEKKTRKMDKEKEKEKGKGKGKKQPETIDLVSDPEETIDLVSDSSDDPTASRAEQLYGRRLGRLSAAQREAVELNPTVDDALAYLSGQAGSSRNSAEKAQLAMDAIELMER
jgi:hypothetical protein